MGDMSAGELIAELGSLGVRLRVVDSKLGVSAPEGVITEALRAEIVEHRDSLISMLLATCGVHDLCRMWKRLDGGWVCGVCHPNPKDIARQAVESMVSLKHTNIQTIIQTVGELGEGASEMPASHREA